MSVLPSRRSNNVDPSIHRSYIADPLQAAKPCLYEGEAQGCPGPRPASVNFCMSEKQGPSGMADTDEAADPGPESRVDEVDESDPELP
jgi:hypothetical protein